MLKIGQINFINCLPINLPLERLGLADDIELEIIEGPPAVLNEKLRNGELDLAPISSYEYLQNKDKYQYLDGISISSKVEADSVLFFCNLEFWAEEKKVIHVTNKSATSVNLLKILLRELYKLNLEEIEFVTFSDNADYDAKLLIGDEALKEDKSKYEEVLDLGAKWYELTKLSDLSSKSQERGLREPARASRNLLAINEGERNDAIGACQAGLPMVFGLWTVNQESEIYKNSELFHLVNKRFCELRDKGLNDFYPDMIIEAYKQTGVSRSVLKKYFDNLDYGFSERHLKSLTLIGQYSNDVSQAPIMLN